MSNDYGADNRFMSRFSKIIDTLVLGILWLLCSIPVFTVGAASSAAYYAYHKAIRQDQSYMGKEFFAAFRSNFKRATGIWLILLTFELLSVVTCYLLWSICESIPMAGVMLTMGAVIVCVVAVWCIYVFAYQARFENTMGNVLKNSLMLTVLNLPWSVLLLLIMMAAVAVIWRLPPLYAPVVAIYLWLNNKILERIFRKIMTEEERIAEMQLE